MSNVKIIAVGIDKWDLYTKPMIETLREYEPEVGFVIVDNASNPEYDVTAYYNVKKARTVKRLGYAAAMNFGADLAGDPDWYMFLNNDVYFKDSFVWRFDDLDPLKFHGMNTYDFKGWPYICGWCMMVSREVWQKVGKFDSSLVPMWFEDADYSIRCQKAGIPLETHDRYEWGVIHIEDENHKDRVHYLNTNKTARVENRAYVERKHGLR